MTIAAMTRNNGLHLRTVEWLSQYFFEHADSEPNRWEMRLDLCEKKDVWNYYMHEMQNSFAFLGSPTHLDYTTFVSIWNNVFPWVKIRVYKQVSGKCWVCYWINELRKTSEDQSILLAAKKLHQLHRGGLYMLERKR
jgi:hypothetical protein